MARRLLAFALVSLVLAAAPAPAGSVSRGCSLPPVADPGIRASFERFDRSQSAAAAQICAFYMNHMDAAVAAP